MAVVHPDLRKSLKDPPKETVEFRKIDFGVTTGHYYRYRVRLATGDAQGRQVWGDWSQPSKLKQIEPAAKK
jgi:hypothetical protein